MARGFTQVAGVDYNEIFLLMVKYYSIKVLRAIVSQYIIELKKMNVKIFSIHGNIKDTIYMKKLGGFVENKSKVYFLK